MRVAKEKLLLIAGFVWLAAGLNIAILGVSAFTEMGEHAMLVLVPAAIVAFTVFHAGMFSKLVGKHHAVLKLWKKIVCLSGSSSILRATSLWRS